MSWEKGVGELDIMDFKDKDREMDTVIIPHLLVEGSTEWMIKGCVCGCG